MRRHTLLLCVALGIVSGHHELLAGVDEGMSRFVPWSGSYWPIRDGQLIQGPLRKYDQATGHRAAAWELDQNPPSPTVPEWYGYCHAWAAAAVTDREPVAAMMATGLDGRPIELGVGDQKGMLTASHTDDIAQHYGVRFQGEPGEDPQDIYPDELWRVLKLYVKQRGVPLIVDIESGTQVWNFPVYAYRVEYQPAGPNNVYFGEMSLWMADDDVPPDMIGVQVSKQTYYFTFRMQGGEAVLGTSRWIEPSIHSHPDFAWFPYVVRPENPEVKYEKVKQLIRVPPAEQPSATLPGQSVPPNPPSDASISLTFPTDHLPGTAGPVGIPPNVISPAGSGAPSVRDERPPAYLMSPMELLTLLVNRTSHFTLDVTVDKFDGGRYSPGEMMRLSGTSARDGYLYMLYIDSRGETRLFFPRAGDNNFVAAQRRFQLPADNAAYAFHTMDAPGIHRIKVVVTAMPLYFSGTQATRAAASGHAIPPTRFELPPSQTSMYRDYLVPQLRNGRMRKKDLGGSMPHEFLGDFGQDEVAIYVGPSD